jgi:hypothetical protein
MQKEEKTNGRMPFDLLGEEFAVQHQAEVQVY